mgnify:CR=1 FL=1
MVEIFAVQEPTRTEEGNIIAPFRVPAVSERLARRRAIANARLKGWKSPSVQEVEEIASGDVPGQSIYEVTVISQR